MIDKVLALHSALDAADVPHAFGGAIALAYCLRHPRGTIDIDVNVFVPVSRADAVFASLPPEVSWTDTDVEHTKRDEQVRLWWDETAIDLFFAAHPFHDDAGEHRREVPFEGVMLPVLGCTSLAVFKALYNRTKDWSDLEAMSRSGSLDVDAVTSWLEQLLGGDERVTRVRALVGLEAEDDSSPGRTFTDLIRGDD